MNPDPVRDKAIAALVGAALCAAVLALAFSGCATSNQTLTTADGDHYTRRGVSLFSKQDAEGTASLIAYPNGSGLEFQIGDTAAQDSTGLIPLVQALVQAFASPSTGALGAGLAPAGQVPLSPAQPFSDFQARLERLEHTLTRLSELVGSGWGGISRPKSAVGPVAPER